MNDVMMCISDGPGRRAAVTERALIAPGGSQHRVLVISNDEYNRIEELAVWALTVVRDGPHPDIWRSALAGTGPSVVHSSGIHSVVQILDRSALRDTHGFVSHATMTTVEDALREFPELP